MKWVFATFVIFMFGLFMLFMLPLAFVSDGCY